MTNLSNRLTFCIIKVQAQVSSSSAKRNAGVRRGSTSWVEPAFQGTQAGLNLILGLELKSVNYFWGLDKHVK